MITKRLTKAKFSSKKKLKVTKANLRFENGI